MSVIRVAIVAVAVSQLVGCQSPQATVPVAGPSAAWHHLAQVRTPNGVQFAICMEPACPTRTTKTVASAPVERRDASKQASSANAIATVVQPGKKSSDLQHAIDIPFSPGSAILTEQAKGMLTAALSAARNAHKVEIRGRTDDRGGLEANIRIAEERAAVVERFFIEQLPADRPTIRAGSAALCCYLDANETSAGRTRNRRAEVHFSVSEQ